MTSLNARSLSNASWNAAALFLLSLVAACGAPANGSDDAGLRGDGAAPIDAQPDAAPSTIPTVTSVSPLSGASAVAVNINPTATFSEAMDAATLMATTFTLTHGDPAVLVPGTVIYAGYGSTMTERSAFRFNALDRSRDGFFVKLSYLFRV